MENISKYGLQNIGAAAKQEIVNINEGLADEEELIETFECICDNLRTILRAEGIRFDEYDDDFQLDI